MQVRNISIKYGMFKNSGKADRGVWNAANSTLTMDKVTWAKQLEADLKNLQGRKMTLTGEAVVAAVQAGAQRGNVAPETQPDFSQAFTLVSTSQNGKTVFRA